jgi:hypothetical protein
MAIDDNIVVHHRDKLTVSDLYPSIASSGTPRRVTAYVRHSRLVGKGSRDGIVRKMVRRHVVDHDHSEAIGRIFTAQYGLYTVHDELVPSSCRNYYGHGWRVSEKRGSGPHTCRVQRGQPTLFTEAGELNTIALEMRSQLIAEFGFYLECELGGRHPVELEVHVEQTNRLCMKTDKDTRLSVWNTAGSRIASEPRKRLSQLDVQQLHGRMQGSFSH